MNEAELNKRIVKALRKEGAFAVKIHGGMMQARALPDIIGCYEGIFFGIEGKMPGKEDTLTDLQAKKLRDIKKAGGVAFMSTSIKHSVRGVKLLCHKKRTEKFL